MYSLISSKGFLGGVFGGFTYNTISSADRDNLLFPFNLDAFYIFFLPNCSG